MSDIADRVYQIIIDTDVDGYHNAWEASEKIAALIEALLSESPPLIDTPNARNVMCRD